MAKYDSYSYYKFIYKCIKQHTTNSGLLVIKETCEGNRVGRKKESQALNDLHTYK